MNEFKRVDEIERVSNRVNEFIECVCERETDRQRG